MPRHRALSPEAVQELLAEYRGGATTIERLAAQHGISYNTAWRILRDNQVRKRRRGGTGGILVGHREYGAIVRLHDLGLRHRDIAALLGMPHTTISSRLKRAGVAGRDHRARREPRPPAALAILAHVAAKQGDREFVLRLAELIERDERVLPALVRAYVG